MKERLLIYSWLLFPIFGFSQYEIEDLSVLSGIWKIEDKEQYEVWELKDNRLQGTGYIIENGQRLIKEFLLIEKVGSEILYRATVPGQNDGRSISFKFRREGIDQYIFENPEHDFPKRIIYEKRGKDIFYVSVLGENEKGFSFKMIRQR